MTLKKNSFKLFSFTCVIFISSCALNVAEIEGTANFSSMKNVKESHYYHRVKYGDTLWGISNQYYNTPYLWPEIYKSNTDIIYDADLILPGQSIIIYGNISRESQIKAKVHAKTRGLWVVGYREEADIKFLENN